LLERIFRLAGNKFFASFAVSFLEGIVSLWRWPKVNREYE